MRASCNKATAVFAFLLLIAGAASGFESQQSWEVRGTDADGTARVARIVERRFKEIKPSFFDSVGAQANGNLVSLRFTGWRPSSTQLDALTQTKGTLRITLERVPAEPLITEKDVEKSGFLASSEVAIRLTDSAAQRVAKRTANTAGDVVVVQWDGRTIARLRVAGPLQRDIGITASSVEDAQLKSAVLTSGPLPEGVSLKATGQE